MGLVMRLIPTPCRGARTPVGKPLGICIACTSRTDTARNDPPAIRSANGEWSCSERRSDGAHESDCAQKPASGEPLGVGDGRAYSTQSEGAQ